LSRGIGVRRSLLTRLLIALRSDVPRCRQVVVRFSDAELVVVRERAASAGLAVGAWIGQSVLDDARKGSGSVSALPDRLRLHSDVVAMERAGVVDRGRLDELLVRLEAVVEKAAGEFEVRR
jgi:hypothetical protein